MCHCRPRADDAAMLIRGRSDGGARAAGGPFGRLLVVSLMLAAAGVSCSSSASTDSSSHASAASPAHSATQSVAGGLHYVAFGDSWPEGAHCGGCETFAGQWADRMRVATGRQIEFTDFTGSRERTPEESKESASLLAALRHDTVTRAAVRDADVLLIATGPNELGDVADPLANGSCGGTDGFDCIRALGAKWRRNFDAILTEIDKLRDGKPTATRLVNAANPFVSDPSVLPGMPKTFATTGGALIFDLLTKAVCAAATKHHATCVDVRPLLNGRTLTRPVDENSSHSMRVVTDALVATGLPELGMA